MYELIVTVDGRTDFWAVSRIQLTQVSDTIQPGLLSCSGEGSAKMSDGFIQDGVCQGDVIGEGQWANCDIGP